MSEWRQEDFAAIPGWRQSSVRMFRGQHQPPANELPVAVPTPEIEWRGDGIVLAIPSLYVYTSGAEMMILCRTSHAQRRTIQHVRELGDPLKGLRANGVALDAQTGQHNEHGYTYRAWTTFLPEDANRDLVFTLDRNGITPAEHRVPAATISAAVGRVKTLWPA